MITVSICSSANFYRQAADIQEQLTQAGLKALIPEVAEDMKRRGDYDVSYYKTWFGDANDYSKKARFIRGHFAEIEKSDVVLVLNYEKHGVQNYIGGNVLMEMAIAFYLNKPIYILNEAPQDSPLLEEILGMQPTILGGDLASLKALA